MRWLKKRNFGYSEVRLLILIVVLQGKVRLDEYVWPVTNVFQKDKRMWPVTNFLCLADRTSHYIYLSN